jgi:hypothetical protein
MRYFVVLVTTLLTVIAYADSAQAGAIRVTCTKLDSITAATAIDIWVSYAGQSSDQRIRNMRVVWTLPDGSTVDRTTQYSQDLRFDTATGWRWSGQKPGTMHAIGGFLTWSGGAWKYTEKYWPNRASGEGSETTFAEGCTGTDGNNLE